MSISSVIVDMAVDRVIVGCPTFPGEILRYFDLAEYAAGADVVSVTNNHRGDRNHFRGNGGKFSELASSV
jgi:hypothetical protein